MARRGPAEAPVIIFVIGVAVAGVDIQIIIIITVCPCPGPWSDNSDEIKNNPAVLKETNSSVADDGEFLMTVEDVTKYGEGLEGVDCFETLPKDRTKIVA